MPARAKKPAWLVKAVADLDSLWTLEPAAKFAYFDRLRARLARHKGDAAAIEAADGLTYRIEAMKLDAKRQLHRTAVEQLRSALLAL